MKYKFSLILAFLLTSVLCIGQSKIKLKHIKAVKLITHLPGIKVSQGNKMVEQDMTYNVFYSGDLIMYQFFYGFGTGAIDDKNATHETRHNFFVFHKDSLYGYAYSPYTEANNHRLGRKPVRETLDHNVVNTGNMDTLALFKPDSSFTDKKENLTNWYSLRLPGQPKAVVILHYTKDLAWAVETFSTKLDNISKHKLTKVSMYIDDVCNPPCPPFTKDDPLFLELKELKDFDRNEVGGYFERYRKEVN